MAATTIDIAHMPKEIIGEVVIAGEAYAVELDRNGGRIELRLGDDVVFVTIRLRGSVLSLVHTEVPRARRNQGVGDAFVKAVLDHARTASLTIRPICPFVATYLRRHPEYMDAVDPAHPARMDE